MAILIKSKQEVTVYVIVYSMIGSRTHNNEVKNAGLTQRCLLSGLCYHLSLLKLNDPRFIVVKYQLCYFTRNVFSKYESK